MNAPRKSPRSTDLSERESSVIKLAGEGLTDKEIAKEVGVELSTIRTYWERIRIKLGAHNRAHAVVLGHGQSDPSRAAGDELAAFILRRITDEAIFVCGRDGVIQTWNEGVLNLLGYEEKEWVGQHQAIFFIPEEKGEAQLEIDQADEAGASVHDRWHVRKDGSRFWGTNTVIHLEGDGGFAKIVRLKPEPEPG